MLKERRRSGFTLIELMIVVAVIGILAALAIPNFMKFLAKSKQGEARVNLGEIYVCQQAYFGENGTYAGGDNAFNLIGFAARSPLVSKYAFIMDTAEITGPRTPSSLPSGLPSTASSFTAIAAGNIDGDTFIDIWGINDVRDIQNKMPTTSGWGADGNDVQN